MILIMIVLLIEKWNVERGEADECKRTTLGARMSSSSSTCQSKYERKNT
jgi:hypothetical protein